MARFFLRQSAFEQDRATITGPELNHLRRVLRLRPGDRVVLFDNAGWEHQGIIRSLSEGRGDIEITGSYQKDNESPLKITLALGLTKGEKMDLVVEKATELGLSPEQVKANARLGELGDYAWSGGVFYFPTAPKADATRNDFFPALVAVRLNKFSSG